MKNISRRVFIKGMAVAAVATAASTVLTGCKLPTTPDELPTEEVPSVVQSQVYEEAKDKTLTFSSTALSVSEDARLAILSVKVLNKTANTFEMKKDSTKASTGYYTNADSVTVYFDGQKGNLGSFNTQALKDNLLENGTSVNAGYSKEGKLYINTPKTWSKMTVVVEVVKATTSNNNDYTVKTMEFNFNK